AHSYSRPSFPRIQWVALGPRFRAGLSGENVCALQTSPRKELLNPPSSCPALCRASTPFFFRRQDVDGRDKPGHDDEGESSAAHLQPHFFPRTALRASGNPGRVTCGSSWVPAFAGTTRSRRNPPNRGLLYALASMNARTLGYISVRQRLPLKTP